MSVDSGKGREELVVELEAARQRIAELETSPDRKQTEEALRESEEKYRLLFDNESDAIFIVDGETLDILDANPVALALYGYTREEILTMKAMDLSAGSEKTEKSIGTSLRSGLEKVALRLHRKKNGTVFPVEISGSRFALKGKAVNCSFIRDITERKRAEERLRESETFIKTVMENLPIGIAVNSVDPLVHFEYMNENFPRFYRTNREALTRQDGFWDAVYEDSEFRREIRTRVLEDCASGDPERMYWVDVPVTRKGEETRFITARNTPVTDKGLMISTVLDVTDRKRAEEELLESQAFYRDMFYNNEAVKLLIDPVGGRIVEANPAACSFYGYDESTLTSMCVWDINTLGKEDVRAKMSSTGEGQKGHFHFRHRLAGGEIRDVEVFSGSIERRGKALLLSIIVDITDRKRAEKALWESEERFRQLSEMTFEAIAFHDNGVVLQVNDQYCRMFGYEPEELLGKDGIKLTIAPESESVIRENIARGGTDPYEATGRRKDGFEFPIEIQARWSNYKGRTVRVGVIRDITERKRAEEALRKSHEQFLTVLNSIPADVYVSDMETYEVLFANKHMENSFKTPLVGKTCWDAFRKESGPCANCTNDMLLDPDGNPTDVIVWEGRNPITKRWHMNYDRAVRWSDGRLVKLQIATDITDRKKMEEQLLQAKELAEAASRAKSEFLANMSHEIRTPLNGVLGMLQVLQESPLDGGQKECLEAALESGRSLLQVIGDILDISRIESGKMDIRREQVGISDLIQSIQGAFMNEVARKGLTFSYHIDSALPAVVEGDSGRLRQILFNLVGNAIKFTKQGGVDVRVYPEGIENGADRFDLCLEVSDAGIGIPQGKLAAIFEPFTQADGSHTREYGGTGLGLAIVKRLLDLMNGTVQIESKEGVGTTVCCRIPVQSLPDGETRNEIQEQSASCAYNLKILLAEDDLSNQLVAKRMLEKQGHTVTCVATGREALAVLDKDKFDLILMDVQMPEMDGTEATREIRKDERFRGLPIVALTAHAMAGDRERFLEAGMDDYLSKPVELEGLTHALDRAMAGRR